MISLLNTTHQWFKAEDGMGCSETISGISFCNGSCPLSITSRDSNNFILNAPPPDVPSSHLRSLASADPQRQFEEEERDYLSNFGINIVNEVLKRRVIITNSAKGAFISSISHELRNPLQRSN
ncbi:hypothetical protein RhiirA4_485540 [Rhizophagus irregularis]|uniref:Signal transduction histidine kinase dimerisation/phosphoacceptor domain-containing protein n=1 Tax=Rhizophagus irregularis TaxID=588596 RepID=A0A2I1HQB4_9GLOM|nr:hypothetical protein RhiirA4_485540 [Rhizophagus irregularis]